MEVILLERIGRLGGMGDVVKVKDGYARNFLLPQKKALRATAESRAEFETRRAELEKHNNELRAAAEKVAEKLKGVSLTLIRQAGEDGRLYGSVGGRDIADALVEKGHEVERRMVLLDALIKTTGTTMVKVQLHPEVLVHVPVQVARTEGEAADIAPEIADEQKELLEEAAAVRKGKKLRAKKPDSTEDTGEE